MKNTKNTQGAYSKETKENRHYVITHLHAKHYCERDPSRAYIHVAVVSHIERIISHPVKTTLHREQFRSWYAEQGNENKKGKSGSAYPPNAARTGEIN